MNVFKAIPLVLLFSLLYLASCCSTKKEQQTPESVSTVEDSVPAVDSASYQQGLNYSVEEKLHKTHKKKLKK